MRAPAGDVERRCGGGVVRAECVVRVGVAAARRGGIDPRMYPPRDARGRETDDTARASHTQMLGRSR